jgi:DNA-binding NarL/FixJ family response regulator
MTITILLADDHPIVRRGLRSLFEAEPNFSVVGETGDGLEAVKLSERLDADVLVVDIMMPGLNGLEVTRQVRQRCPRTHVAVLSVNADEPYVLEALRNGASAYVLKGCNGAELVRAVRETAAGRHYLGPPLSERALEMYRAKPGQAPKDSYELLTPREREVLQLAAEGYSSTEIGDRLNISKRTAETHRARLMRKLDLHTHTDLILFALRRGIISKNC